MPTITLRLPRAWKEEGQVMEIDGANLGHAAGEQSVAEGSGKHNGNQRGVLPGRQAMSHLWTF